MARANSRPSEITFGAFVRDEWLSSRRDSSKTRSTKDRTENSLRAWILPNSARSRSKRSSPVTDRVYEELPASDDPKTKDHPDGRPLSAKTVRNVHGLISKFLGDEVRSFLRVASTDRLLAVWRLALQPDPGARLAGLWWLDTDLDAASPSVLVNEAQQVTERLSFAGAWRTDGGLGTEAPWVVTEPDGKVVHPTRSSTASSPSATSRAFGGSCSTRRGTPTPSSRVGFTIDQYAHARREAHDDDAAMLGGVLDGTP